MKRTLFVIPPFGIVRPIKVIATKTDGTKIVSAPRSFDVDCKHVVQQAKNQLIVASNKGQSAFVCMIRGKQYKREIKRPMKKEIENQYEIHKLEQAFAAGKISVQDFQMWMRVYTAKHEAVEIETEKANGIKNPLIRRRKLVG